MKSKLERRDGLAWALSVLFFVVLAAITFRCAFEPNHVFSASDLNIGRLAHMKNSLPERLTGHFTANQLFGASGQSISLFAFLLSLFPLTFFANAFYGAVLILASLSMGWFLRIWGRSWSASVFGALVAFWVSSITMAGSGHAFKMEVLAFSTLGLCLVEKSLRAEAVRRAVGYAILAGLCVGITLVEQADVALLAGLFVGAYTLFRLTRRHLKSPVRWISLLLPIALAALLLSGQTVLQSYERNIESVSTIKQSGDEKWNFVTQWSMVPQEWPDLIALGWAGWSTSHPEAPYWGKIGRSAEWEETGRGFRNFRLDGIYFGVVPFLMGLLGLGFAVRNKNAEERAHILFWGVTGLVGFILAFGKYSLLYKLFYQLPVVNNIRAPIKLLNNFQVCLGIVAAYGLDGLLASGKQDADKLKPGEAMTPVKISGIFSLLAGTIMLVYGLFLSASPSSLARFQELGYDRFAKQLVQNMSMGWLSAGAMALVLGGVTVLVWKKKVKPMWVGLTLIALLAGDSLRLTSNYFNATDISALKRGNVVVDFLKKNQGHDRAYFVDQSGVYNQWLAMDGPYHGLNLFNIWQMPRMPDDYKTFLQTVGRNQIRLWELAGIRHIAAPAAIQQQLKQNSALAKRFEPVLNYQVPTAQGMRPDVVLKFSGYIPRFALYSGWKSVTVDQQPRVLADPNHDVSTSVLIDPSFGIPAQEGSGAFTALDAEVTRKKAVLQVETDRPSIVRFSQYFKPEWTVWVNGKPADLLRVDYLCMGVHIPSGTHTVEFRCMNGLPKVLFMAGVLFVAGISAVVLLNWKRAQV